MLTNAQSWAYVIAATVIILLATYLFSLKKDPYKITTSLGEKFNFHKQPYALYLKSEHFQALRRKLYLQAKGLCQDCNQQVNPNNFIAHHLTYKRIGKEKLQDMECLCPKCHSHPNKHSKVKTPSYARRAN